MTIWILAVLFVASLIGLGLRQGAIRVAASLVGIILGGTLAEPLGNLLKPLMGTVGIKNPMLVWFVPPVIVFVLILTLCKIGGMFLHKKMEVYYKYKAGELRLALWERLNQRLGLCLGTLNALAYIVLLSQVIYMVSYWTYQAQTDSDTRTMKLVNRLGKDLQATGMSKAAQAVDDSPAAYYEAADIAGLLYQNPLLEARLSRYPGILSLAERPEFQELANDAEFSNLRQSRASIAQMVEHPKVQAILSNGDLMKSVQKSLAPNLKDLRTFLETGSSAKYSEPVLGRWNFDVNGSLALFRREKPNMTSREMNQRKAVLTTVAAAAEVIVTPEQQVIFKKVPFVKATTLAPNIQSVQGEWKSQGGQYAFSVPVDGKTEQLSVELVGSRMHLNGNDLLGLAFTREN